MFTIQVVIVSICQIFKDLNLYYSLGKHNSAVNKLMMCFLFFPENKIWPVLQNFS